MKNDRGGGGRMVTRREDVKRTEDQEERRGTSEVAEGLRDGNRIVDIARCLTSATLRTVEELLLNFRSSHSRFLVCHASSRCLAFLVKHSLNSRRKLKANTPRRFFPLITSPISFLLVSARLRPLSSSSSL